MNWKKIYPWKQHFYLIQISILVIIGSSESSKKKKSHIFLHITITECVTWKSMDTSTVNTLKCFMHNIQLHLCTQKIQLRNGLTVYGRTSHFLEHADFCGKIQISFLFGVLSPPAGYKLPHFFCRHAHHWVIRIGRVAIGDGFGLGCGLGCRLDWLHGLGSRGFLT